MTAATIASSSQSPGHGPIPPEGGTYYHWWWDPSPTIGIPPGEGSYCLLIRKHLIRVLAEEGRQATEEQRGYCSAPTAEIPVKKIQHGQLRGTVAAKYRHRIALGFTLGALALSCICSYLLSKMQLNPGKGLEKLEHPKRFFNRIGYKPIMEQEEAQVDCDKF
ncbi:hypothetical protein AVEN_149222-1 [Araneus ventricosus]|uniref:Uncharacterized protein n=1 Tax=Araneus ventricosus TaxID=182803 RepID=A0A4Y2LM30_ARAVE|nr:hypothetical protein AVEN_149222-1 [Araneus ventricosus]